MTDALEKPDLLVFVQRVRDLMQQTVHLQAEGETLAALRKQLDALIDAMAPHVDDAKSLPKFQPHPPHNPNLAVPASPVTGEYNPVAPPVRMTWDGRTVTGRMNVADAYEGPPGWVHGAIVSAVYDQLLSFAAVLSGIMGPTAELTVRFLRPTPLNTDLVFETWVEQHAGRKIFTRGRCWVNGEISTEADALFIEFNPGEGGDNA